LSGISGELKRAVAEDSLVAQKEEFYQVLNKEIV